MTTIVKITFECHCKVDELYLLFFKIYIKVLNMPGEWHLQWSKLIFHIMTRQPCIQRAFLIRHIGTCWTTKWVVPLHQNDDLCHLYLYINYLILRKSLCLKFSLLQTMLNFGSLSRGRQTLKCSFINLNVHITMMTSQMG